jgi:adenylate kinase family enzyme
MSEPLPSPTNQTRILILGRTGSGKSTLARRLSKSLNLPYIELDAVHWQPNWQKPTPNAFRSTLQDKLSKLPNGSGLAPHGSGWVVDGGYSAVRSMLWPAATHALWLDYPFALTMWRLVRRTLSRMWTRQKVCGDNVERWRNLLSFDPEINILMWAWHTRNKAAVEFPRLFEQYGHLQVVRLRTMKGTDEWMKAFVGAYWER